MKFDDTQISTMQDQTGLQPIPDDNPAMEQLKQAFGEHTFYLDEQGLYVWEWIEGPEADGQPVTAVQIATWADEDKTALQPTEPQVVDAVVKLDPDADDEEDGGGSAA
ncbi:MAG: hypothetical protein R3316_04870 [Rhodovibrionaceae bacterium]|nr:hypothetical protein [Rhodovibrionaceae bacterium]